MSDPHLAMSLLTDARLLFDVGGGAVFGGAAGAGVQSLDARALQRRPGGGRSRRPRRRPRRKTCCCGWAWRLLVTALARLLGGWLPVSDMVSATTWTILLSTLAGLVVAHTPLAQFPGRGQHLRRDADLRGGGAGLAEQFPRAGRGAAVPAVRRHRDRAARGAAGAGSPGCSISTCTFAASPRWRTSAASPRRRCWRPAMRARWCRWASCWRCWATSSVPVSGCWWHR